jgi:hypothetical protein
MTINKRTEMLESQREREGGGGIMQKCMVWYSVVKGYNMERNLQKYGF